MEQQIIDFNNSNFDWNLCIHGWIGHLKATYKFSNFKKINIDRLCINAWNRKCLL